MSAPPPDERTAGPRAALTPRNIVRAVLVVLLGVLLGAAAGLAVPRHLHKTYTATSRVLVSPTGVQTANQTNARTVDSINLDTEAQLVTSSSVIQRAVDAYPTLDKQTFEQLVTRIAVTVPPNTTVLQIAFQADTPTVAQAGSIALANAYLDDRSATAKASIAAQVLDADKRVASLQNQIATLTQKAVQSAPGSTPRRTLSSSIAILKNQINGVNDQLVTYNAVQVKPGRVVTAASLPTSPTSPSKVIALASGVGLGLLLGLLAAWLLIRFRRRVRRADDIAQVVDVTTIAVLPKLDKGGVALTEAYRRVALIMTSAVHDADRVLFTTPVASPSGSRVAAGVAEALVRGGTPVGLLRINAHAAGGAKPRGLDLISVPSTDAIARKRGEPLDLALNRVRGGRDLLVVDSAGVTVSADAQAVAAVADAVVLVVDAGTRSTLVRRAVRALDEVGAPVLGVVLVRGRRRPPKAAPAGSVPEQDVFDPSPGWHGAAPDLPSFPALDAAPVTDAAPRQLMLQPPTVPPDPRITALLDGTHFDGTDYDGTNYDGTDYEGTDHSNAAGDERAGATDDHLTAGRDAAEAPVAGGDIEDAEIVEDPPSDAPVVHPAAAEAKPQEFTTEPANTADSAVGADAADDAEPAAASTSTAAPAVIARTRNRGSSQSRGDGARSRIAHGTVTEAPAERTDAPAKDARPKPGNNGQITPTRAR